MRGSLRWLLAQRPSETQLLILLLLSGGFFFLLALAQHAAGGEPLSPGALGGLVFGGVVVFGLIWPLTAYLGALVGHGLARAFGGQGTGRDSRAAMAWAALVSAPVILLASLGGLLLEGALPAEIARAVRSLGLLALAYALSQCMAEAHGFSKGWAVLAVITLLLLSALGALRLLLAS